MARQRGIVQAIRDLRDQLPVKFTTDDVERRLKQRGWNLTRAQVRQGLTRLSTPLYDELEREGDRLRPIYSWKGTARRPLYMEDTGREKDPENPIELLLDAMAKAEPKLRRLLELERVLKDTGD